ncbi:ComEC family competence protein [Candidatus Kaiserbacteria bacterium]|nr:ComEC family competence protein [Candidatus Kaiserbacteria bacterium]
MQRSSAILLLLVGVALGARVWIVLTADEQPFTATLDRTAVVAGRVADDPDRRATSVRVFFVVDTLNTKPAHGTLLVALPPGTGVSYGDRLEVRGLVELAGAFETQGGRQFDYKNYLRVRGVSAVMQRATLRLSTPAGFSILGTLFDLKHAFEKSLERSIPEPQVSLLEGILLGERGGLSAALLAAFVAVGLIHVVVLSGSNISVVSEGVFRMLGFLPRTWVYGVGGGVMVLFVLMTGGGAASVRALLMGLIAILARYLHRTVLALRILIAAAVAMLLWNPLLLYDSGFVLSMLATFGLITLAPHIERRITLVPAWGRFNIRSIVATTLAVELCILPALLYYSGIFSLLSVPINALVLPFVPLVMFFGFVSGVAGLVHPLLSLIPALLTDVLLRLVLFVATLSAATPFASVVVPAFSGWVALAAYVPILVWATKLSMQSASRTPTS